jgi:hypothetical protein
MPESVEEPSSRPDPNLEEQTMAGEEPGPGASKMENLRRAAEQVKTQKERTDDADPKGSVPDREE